MRKTSQSASRPAAPFRHFRATSPGRGSLSYQGSPWQAGSAPAGGNGPDFPAGRGPCALGQKSFFVSDILFHKQGSQEDEHIGLDQAVEQVKVQAEHSRHKDRHHLLDELHDDERAQHVAEQSHTQAGGPNGDLQNVHGGHDGGRSRQALEEADPAARVDPGILDEADAH